MLPPQRTPPRPPPPPAPPPWFPLETGAALTSGNRGSGALFTVLLLVFTAAIGVCCLCVVLGICSRRHQRKQAQAAAAWLASAPSGSKRLGGPSRDHPDEGYYPEGGDGFGLSGKRAGMLTTPSPVGKGGAEPEEAAHEEEASDLASAPPPPGAGVVPSRAGSSKRSSLPSMFSGSSRRSSQPSVRLLPVHRVRSESAPMPRDEGHLVSSQI